jgi:tripartite-type tricarboxylate transporter receptor subunit TctC
LHFGFETADLISGQIQVMIDNMATALQHVRTGAVRALAVTAASRSQLFPELPTIGESVPGYEATSWYGLTAPKDTPREIIDVLNKEINRSLSDPAAAKQLEAIGGTPLPGSPADFRGLIVDETEKWGKVVRFTGAKAS